MDVAPRAVPASSEARAIPAGKRQRWARIYCNKTGAEGKSSVLASSSEMDAEWRAARPSQKRTAGGGTRTHTDLRPGAFEAPSSTIPTLRRAVPGEYIRVRSLGTC